MLVTTREVMGLFANRIEYLWNIWEQEHSTLEAVNIGSDRETSLWRDLTQMKICLDRLELFADDMLWEPQAEAYYLFNIFNHPRLCYWCRRFDNSYLAGIYTYYCLDKIFLRNGKMFDAWRICSVDCYRKTYYLLSLNDPEWYTTGWNAFRLQRRSLSFLGCYN